MSPPPPFLVALAGLVVGAACGFAVRRARLCSFGALESAPIGHDRRRMRVFGLALAIALALTGFFLGSFLAGLRGGELKLEGFHDGQTMRRYIISAALMGFGGMLAAGCAIGAGVSGAAVFSTVSWATLFAMWIAAGAADALVDRPSVAASVAPVAR